MLQNYRPSIRYGIIMGVIAILVFLMVWALAPDMMRSPAWSITNTVLFFIALPIVMQILGARDSKPNFDNFPYGRSFTAAFLVGLVAVLLITLFNLVFYNAIEPGYYEKLKEISLEQTIERLEDMDFSEEQIEEQIRSTEKVMSFTLSNTGTLVVGLGQLLWYTILALLIGIVYKDPKDINQYA